MRKDEIAAMAKKLNEISHDSKREEKERLEAREAADVLNWVLMPKVYPPPDLRFQKGTARGSGGKDTGQAQAAK